MYVCIIVSITCIIASVHFCVCVIGITSRRKWGRYPRSVWAQLVTEFSRHVDIFFVLCYAAHAIHSLTRTFLFVPVVVVPCGKCVSFVYFLFRFLFFFSFKFAFLSSYIQFIQLIHFIQTLPKLLIR